MTKNTWSLCILILALILGLPAGAGASPLPLDELEIVSFTGAQMFQSPLWTGTKATDHDGNFLLVSTGPTVSSGFVRPVGDEFVYETKFRFTENHTSTAKSAGVTIYLGTHRAQLYFFPAADTVDYRTGSGMLATSVPPIGNAWHVLQYVIKDATGVLYLDGAEIVPLHSFAEAGNAPELRFFAECDTDKRTELAIEYIKVTGQALRESGMNAFMLDTEAEGFAPLAETASQTANAAVNPAGNLVVTAGGGWNTLSLNAPLKSAHILKARFRINTFGGTDGNNVNFHIRQEDGRSQIYLNPQNLAYRAATGNTITMPYEIGNGWHTYEVKSIGKDMKLYIDGEFVVATRKSGSYGGQLSVGVNSGSELEIEYMQVKILKENAFEITRKNLKYGETDATSLIACEQLSTDYGAANYTNEAYGYAVIIALYDETGLMEDFRVVEGIHPARLAAGLESARLPLPEVVDGYSVKVFIWDGLQGLRALSSEKNL